MSGRSYLLIAFVLSQAVITSRASAGGGAILGQELYSGAKRYPSSVVPFKASSVDKPANFQPRVCNVQIVEFNGDDRPDLLVCDAVAHAVLVYIQGKDGSWTPQVIGDHLPSPAHATLVDIDGDKDLDVLVAVLGDLNFSDEAIGRAVLLENTGSEFKRHVILDDVRRVADVQAGDFDGDGDQDVIVAEFGYSRGSVLYLQNMGGLAFREKRLIVGPGIIHVPVRDYDGDGDLDIAAVVSQDDEEVWGLVNNGHGEFTPKLLTHSINFNLGSGGLVAADIDSDGDEDLLLPAGDNFEDVFAYPQPYHGCIWLENRGDWQFERHVISTFPGTYAAAAGDFDNDGDNDVALVSMTNDFEDPRNPSLIWLENDGKQGFTPWQIDGAPINQVTIDTGDINGDGRDDIVTGALVVLPWQPSPTPGVTVFNAGAPHAHKIATLPPTPSRRVTWSDLLPDDRLAAAQFLALHNKAVEQDTGEAWLELADALASFGKLPAGAIAYRIAHERLGAQFDVIFRRAVVNERLGRMDLAIQLMQDAIKLAPADRLPDAWYRLGSYHMRLEDADAAYKAFEQAGDLPTAVMHRARLHMWNREFDKAIELADSVLARYPRELEPLRLREQLAFRTGASEEELFVWRDRLMRSTINIRYHTNLEEVLEDRAKYGSSRLMLDGLAKFDNGDLKRAAALIAESQDVLWIDMVARQLAQIQIEIGDAPAAIAALDETVHRVGGTGATYETLADAHARKGDGKAAADYLRQAISMRPTAQRYLKLGQLTRDEKLLPLYAEALSIDAYRHNRVRDVFGPGTRAASAGRAHAMYYLGLAYWVEGAVDKAVGALEAALEADPSHGRAQTALVAIKKGAKAVR